MCNCGFLTLLTFRIQAGMATAKAATIQLGEPVSQRWVALPFSASC